MPDFRAKDYETTTVEAAAGFERYHAEPDWDLMLASDDARREAAEDDPWERHKRGGDR
jgi:hypothetical protein